MLQMKIDVLKACLNGELITWICYKSNLPYCRAKKFVSELVRKGLLAENGRAYRTTVKGQKALMLYMQLQELFSKNESGRC